MVQPGTSLSEYSYSGASLLPITSWPEKPEVKYVLLSEEANEPDKDTFDDFGGGKDRKEIHPLQTASREAWEESIELLMGSEKN